MSDVTTLPATGTRLAPLLTIGTRGSPLALAQAEETRRRLAAALDEPVERFPLAVITTSGDRILDRALAEAGGKGLFTKEIDEAQRAGQVDIAVHSGKDMPTALPAGLVEAGFLEREDPRDVFLSPRFPDLAALPHGATVGTASLRRQALVRRLRPDLRVVLFRGNVQTRLRKLEAGEVEATILAMAGLNRLGLAHLATAILDPMAFLPAVAQGAIGLVIREGDSRAEAACRAITHPATTRQVAAERGLLAALDGSCRTPIAAHAVAHPAGLHLKALVLKPDGAEGIEGEALGQDAAALGHALGRAIRDRLPADFFAPAA